MKISSVEEFKNFVASVQSQPGYVKPFAFGVGISTTDSAGALLDCFFPAPNCQENDGSVAVLAKVAGYTSGTQSIALDSAKISEALSYFAPFENDGKTHANIDALKLAQRALKTPGKKIMAVFIGEAASAPEAMPDAYLRLHLLSHRKVRPHGVNIAGLFKLLPNVAWTSEGPVSIEELPARRAEAMVVGRGFTVHSVDKFPRMTDYVVPSGVRIADASRVRLGAYLGEGTTVMHEGFINFNAGCEGPNMVEGRISAGVFVKKGSDLGGGCSTMGTLSGGGNIVISIGEDCLLGANSGLGIPLGNRCTLEAGLYITAGTKLSFEGKILKASELSGKDDILFRRNSLTGQVEAINKANKVALNAALHGN